MKYTIEHRTDGPLLVLSGRLDSLRLEDSFYRALRADLAFVTCDQVSPAIYVDLRQVEFADSRSLFRMREVLAQVHAAASVVYVGPGPGVARLAELGEAPPLEPMRPLPPWEEEAPPVAELPPERKTEEESPEFRIDLDLERIFLESRCDARDRELEGVETPIEFASAWKTLERGS